MDMDIILNFFVKILNSALKYKFYENHPKYAYFTHNLKDEKKFQYQKSSEFCSYVEISDVQKFNRDFENLCMNPPNIIYHLIISYLEKKHRNF